MDITEVARRSGLRASTLRFSEEKGLVASVGRRSLRRVFNPGVLERRTLIAVGRSAGFWLDVAPELPRVLDVLPYEVDASDLRYLRGSDRWPCSAGHGSERASYHCADDLSSAEFPTHAGAQDTAACWHDTAV